MQSLTKIAALFIVAINFSFISCKGKSGKASIVGKWIYKELIYSSDRNKDLNEKQRQRRKEEDDEEAKGTIFVFNKDNTFSISQPGKKQGSMTGTYKITEDGELSMTRSGDPKVETAKVSLTGKNTLELQDQKNGVTVVFNRIQE